MPRRGGNPWGHPLLIRAYDVTGALGGISWPHPPSVTCEPRPLQRSALAPPPPHADGRGQQPVGAVKGWGSRGDVKGGGADGAGGGSAEQRRVVVPVSGGRSGVAEGSGSFSGVRQVWGESGLDGG